jgi:23S rRNA (adenine2503-C2)-methyltransferase
MFKVVKSTDENVCKYVFTGEDYVAETVLYRYGSYEKRTVICCSVQCGCPVGCTFCGTGKKFFRNLKHTEIVQQVLTVLWENEINTSKCERLQIMFMSMGEPMLNWENVKKAIIILDMLYPNAELLLSTVGVYDTDILKDIINLSKRVHNLGLQFSIHRSTNLERSKLIPFPNLMRLPEIAQFGTRWKQETNKKVYLNYCVDGTNNSRQDAENLMFQFYPDFFNFTFSVVCSADETMKDAGFRNLDTIRDFEQIFLSRGYDTRIFDPAGQDDIGGGCGQLWYTQEWMRNEKA